MTIATPHEKHETIRDLVARLRLSERDWRIVDHWDADLHAIGIESSRHPGRLVYVSTFERLAGHYFYELEEPPRAPHDVHTPAGGGADVTFDELLAILSAHLDAE